MVKKRPCRICHRWFRPHPRAGDRQKVCSRPDCQVERHRRASGNWLARNPDYHREHRLRERINPGASLERKPDFGCNPMQRLALDAVQDAVGLEVAVVIEESGKVLAEWVQDAVSREIVTGRGFPVRLPRVAAQDEIAPRGPSP